MSKPIKIYHFPNNLEGKYIVIGENNTFESWSSCPSVGIKGFQQDECVCKIGDYLDYNWGRLAVECWKGKCEDFCIWRADEENQENQGNRQLIDITKDYSLDRFND